MYLQFEGAILHKEKKNMKTIKINFSDMYAGFDKENNIISNLLKERYDLPDRRGDKRYISWQRNKDNLEEKYAEKINN